jgi:flagellar basal body-associated protein FliL
VSLTLYPGNPLRRHHSALSPGKSGVLYIILGILIVVSLVVIAVVEFLSWRFAKKRGESFLKYALMSVLTPIIVILLVIYVL